MTTKPDYLAQTGEIDITDHEACRDWFRTRAREAWDQGCEWPRFSIHPGYGLLLIESWKESPDDYGEPRWQLVRDGGE